MITTINFNHFAFTQSNFSSLLWGGGREREEESVVRGTGDEKREGAAGK